jgi:hypothetical protein
LREDNAGFGRVIKQVLLDQETISKTVAGKVGAFMGQMYPIAGFVLSMVSFGADVNSSHSKLQMKIAHSRIF